MGANQIIAQHWLAYQSWFCTKCELKIGTKLEGGYLRTSQCEIFGGLKKNRHISLQHTTLRENLRTKYDCLWIYTIFIGVLSSRPVVNNVFIHEFVQFEINGQRSESRVPPQD